MLATDDATSSHPTHSAPAELSCGTHQLAARQDVLQAVIITAKLVFAENLVSMPKIAHACPPNFIDRGGVVNLLFRAARMHAQNQGNCMRSGTHARRLYRKLVKNSK